jgi:hypothetical protein
MLSFDEVERWCVLPPTDRQGTLNELRIVAIDLANNECASVWDSIMSNMHLPVFLHIKYGVAGFDYEDASRGQC